MATHPALLFATYLHRSEITIRVLDPPSEKWRCPYARERTSDDPPFSVQSRTEREPSWIVERPEEFRADIARVSASGALAFAGAYGAAAAALPEYTRRRRELPTLGDEPLDESGGFNRAFVGTRSALPVRSDLRVEVFAGVERGLYDAAVRQDIDYLMDARRVEQPAQGTPGEGLLETDDETYLRILDPDGTFFEVRTRER
jgi:hypothetical protein